MNNDFPVLTKHELKILKMIHKNKYVNKDEIDYQTLQTLFKYRFIDNNYDHKSINEFGEPTFDYVSTTSEYLRYKKFLRNNFIERKFPIIISTLALIVSFVALYFSYLQL